MMRFSKKTGACGATKASTLESPKDPTRGLPRLVGSNVREEEKLLRFSNVFSSA